MKQRGEAVDFGGADSKNCTFFRNMVHWLQIYAGRPGLVEKGAQSVKD